MRMIKKAQFGWVGELTGSEYTMGPRSNQKSKPKVAKKVSTKAKEAAKKKVK